MERIANNPLSFARYRAQAAPKKPVPGIHQTVTSQPLRPQRGRIPNSANADLFAPMESTVDLERYAQERIGCPASWQLLYPADLSEVLSKTEDLWMRIHRHPDLRMHVAFDCEWAT